MHHHAGRFINHHQIIIFENNVKMDMLGHQRARYQGRDANLGTLSGFQVPTGFCNLFTIHTNKTIPDQSLYSATRKFRQAGRQEYIQAFFGFFLEQERLQPLTHPYPHLRRQPAWQRSVQLRGASPSFH